MFAILNQELQQSPCDPRRTTASSSTVAARRHTRRRAAPIGLAALVALTAWAPAPAEAQLYREPNWAPTAVTIYLHPEVTDRRFLEPLRCALEKVLVAPVLVMQDLPLPLGPELHVNGSQLDATRVLERFWDATSKDGDDRTFKELIVARDLRDSPYRYVFARMSVFGVANSPAQVISTARYNSRAADQAGGGPALLARRLYKSILRSVVQSSGHFAMTGCVMAFPMSLEEHDAKPAHLCPADHAVLVRQGVLREREKETCDALVSWNDPPARPTP